MACELATTLAADTLARRSSKMSKTGLLACASVFAETAHRLSQLDVPDPRRVEDELVACRAACVLAREACAVSDDVVARRCMLDCQRCEDACAVVTSSFRRAA